MFGTLFKFSINIYIFFLTFKACKISLSLSHNQSQAPGFKLRVSDISANALTHLKKNKTISGSPTPYTGSKIV